MTKRKGTVSKRSVSPATARTTVAPTPPTTGGFDLKLLRDLARIANEYDLESVELRPDGGICISRVPASGARMVAAPMSPASLSLVPPVASSPSPKAEAPKLEDGVMITSPFVGTFYRASSPENPPFAEVGQSIRKGQVVCIVEAMKLMNEIEADVDGKLIEVLVKNGEHVEYGQPLFRMAKL
ncbi:MAG: acetyl-CoA carboxylase biotin carboxyl carrier protein [Deltaproteobacteria bacterium]|nr:acetyl-CoA carboxylase biotin carboxyl carrier protein [Deltaproteobacteria bacterium]